MSAPSTPVVLPAVHDAILDDATLAQLFFDVAHAGELLGVTLKPPGAVRAAPPGPPPPLEEVHRALVARELRGVQLRYRFGGEEWWDTLTHTGAGVRLVRISHTRAFASANRA